MPCCCVAIHTRSLLRQTTQIVPTARVMQRLPARSAHFYLQVKACLRAALTGGVVHRSPAVVAEQGSVQVRVCLLQGHTQVEEMVALLVHQHLQKVVDFLGAGRAVLVQLEPIELTQGAGDYEQLDDSVRICYGLQ